MADYLLGIIFFFVLYLGVLFFLNPGPFHHPAESRSAYLDIPASLKIFHTRAEVPSFIV